MGTRRSGRWLRRGGIAIVLGVAMTVGIAWAGMYTPRLTGSTFRKPEDAGRSSRLSVPEGWTVRTWLDHRGWWTDVQLVSECVWAGSTLGSMSGLGPQRTMLRVGSGWPWPALEYSDLDDTNRGATPTAWEFGLPLPGNKLLGSPRLATGQEIRLPIRPRWALFAGSVAVWSGVWWIGTMVVRSVVHRRREARGLCPGCAYPLTGADVCPECGRTASFPDSARRVAVPKLTP